jgi:hypothetical protein
MSSISNKEDAVSKLEHSTDVDGESQTDTAGAPADGITEEDIESILGNNSTAKEAIFKRYAVPVQYEGNSSDDEEEAKAGVDIESLSIHDEDKEESVDDDPSHGYAPLISDEFGEFVSSEQFGDYYTPDVVQSFREGSDAKQPEKNSTEMSETKFKTNEDSKAEASRNQERNVHVCIPPLDAGNII